MDINAKKCPHCASDITRHTENVRRHLAELDEITAELEQLHASYMECREEEAAMQPFMERLRRVIAAHQTATGIKTVLPAFLLFFAFVITLRMVGNGPLFWAGSIAGGFVAYSILKRSSYKCYVNVDLYRAVLIVGLIIVMSGAVGPLSGWSGIFVDRVEVIQPVANIRAAATTDSRVVGVASRGDKLTVVEKQGSWYQVKTKDGQTGWVYASLVRD